MVLPHLKRPSVHRVYLCNVQNNKVNMLKIADHITEFSQVRHKLWSGAGAKVIDQGPSMRLEVQELSSCRVFIIQAQRRNVNSGPTRTRLLRQIFPKNVQKCVFHFRAKHSVPKNHLGAVHTLSNTGTTFADALCKVESHSGVYQQQKQDEVRLQRNKIYKKVNLHSTT